jgi:secreted Zn-dependent insulinase-like peptidase
LYAGDLRGMLPIVSQMMHEPCFSQLRSNEQLAYTVLSEVEFENTWAGCRILLQIEQDCNCFESKIESFLNRSEQILKEVRQEELEIHQSAIIGKCSADPENLSRDAADSVMISTVILTIFHKVSWLYPAGIVSIY